jgi:hypothetical protein
MPVQQPMVDTGAKMKALYIYSFAKNYFDWPTDYKSGNFIIAFAGEPTAAFKEQFTNITSNKSIGSQKIEIKYLKSIEEVEKYHVLFVPRESQFSVQKLISKCKSQSTLLITEKEGYAQQGASISLTYRESKLKYEFNKAVVSKQRITVSSEFEKNMNCMLVN